MSAEYNCPAKAESAWIQIKENVPAIPDGKTCIHGEWGWDRGLVKGFRKPLETFSQVHLTGEWEAKSNILVPCCFLLFLFYFFDGELYF